MPGQADLSRDISRLMLDIIKDGMQTAARQASELGLKPPQMMFLVMLADRGRTSMRDISREMALHPAAVTRFVDQLIERGLVERMRDESDRRVVRVDLTPEGRNVIERILEFYRDRMEEALSGISRRNMERLAGFLVEMDKTLGEKAVCSRSRAAGRL